MDSTESLNITEFHRYPFPDSAGTKELNRTLGTRLMWPYKRPGLMFKSLGFQMEPTPCEKPSLSDCKRNFYHAKKWAIWLPCALSSDLRNKETLTRFILVSKNALLLVTVRYSRLNPLGINTRGYVHEKGTVHLYGKQTTDTIIVFSKQNLLTCP